MSKLILHIGMHKTGTTYLQQYYFPNCEGLDYINFYGYFYDNKNFPSNNSLLISNEGLSGIPWNESWLKGKTNDFDWLDSFQASVHKIKEVFNDPIVVVMFRKHGDLLVSLYKQYVQEGGVLKLKEFYGDEGVIKPIDLLFRKRIDILTNLFDNVYFLSYEDFKNSKDEYFDKFFSNLNISTIRSKNRVKVSQNISISGKKVELLRRINKIYYIPINIKRKLRKLRISPRDVFQNHLHFWKTKDSIEMINFRQNINKNFESDWEYFEKMKWNYKKE